MLARHGALLVNSCHFERNSFLDVPLLLTPWKPKDVDTKWYAA